VTPRPRRDLLFVDSGSSENEPSALLQQERDGINAVGQFCPRINVSSCGDDSAIKVRWHCSFPSREEPMDFICPKCGHGAFKLIADTVERMECLSCGSLTSLRKHPAHTEQSHQHEEPYGSNQ
jgi:ribosomal protein S27AE